MDKAEIIRDEAVSALFDSLTLLSHLDQLPGDMGFEAQAAVKAIKTLIDRLERAQVEEEPEERAQRKADELGDTAHDTWELNNAS